MKVGRKRGAGQDRSLLIQQHHVACPAETAAQDRGQDAVRPDDDFESSTNRLIPLANRHRDFPVTLPFLIQRQRACPGAPLLHDRRPPRLPAIELSRGITHPAADQVPVRPNNCQGMEISMLFFAPSLDPESRLRRRQRSFHGCPDIGKRGKPLHPFNFSGKQ